MWARFWAHKVPIHCSHVSTYCSHVPSNHIHVPLNYSKFSHVTFPCFKKHVPRFPYAQNIKFSHFGTPQSPEMFSIVFLPLGQLVNTTTYCKIATQLYQEVLGNANQYMDFVQYESWNIQTWHPCTNIQRVEKGFPLHQQYGV